MIGSDQCWCLLAPSHYLKQYWPIELNLNLDTTIFLHEPTFQYVTCKVTTILTRPRRVNHHRFRKWIVAWTAPSHYLNQCWNIVNWTLRNKLQWNFTRNSYIFIQENALENVVCEMASILSRPQYVKKNSVVRLIKQHYLSRHPASTLGPMALS